MSSRATRLKTVRKKLVKMSRKNKQRLNKKSVEIKDKTSLKIKKAPAVAGLGVSSAVRTVPSARVYDKGYFESARKNS